jgi:hypothetical protein
LTKKNSFARDFGLRGQIQDAAGSFKGFKVQRFRRRVQRFRVLVKFEPLINTLNLPAKRDGPRFA